MRALRKRRKKGGGERVILTTKVGEGGGGGASFVGRGKKGVVVPDPSEQGGKRGRKTVRFGQ